MFDQQQKRLGLPSSDDLTKESVMDKASMRAPYLARQRGFGAPHAKVERERERECVVLGKAHTIECCLRILVSVDPRGVLQTPRLLKPPHSHCATPRRASCSHVMRRRGVRRALVRLCILLGLSRNYDGHAQARYLPGSPFLPKSMGGAGPEATK